MRFKLLLVVALAFPAVSWAQGPQKGDGKPVKLAVLLVFDQLRGDYPGRWKEHYGTDGFNRFLEQGAWYANAHYPYAVTVTGAGHASLAAGAPPSVHGIIGNDWRDPATGASVYCATTERWKRVPPAVEAAPKPATTTTTTTRKGSGSPERLLAPTVGDALRAGPRSESKIASFSLKDRGAVLPGGRMGNIVYWWDSERGEFVTSTYYRDNAAGWVSAFNAKKPADRWFGTTWNRLRADLDYERFSGPDDVPGEGTGSAKKQGRVFPHPFPSESGKPDKTYYGAVYASPFSNELLADFALEAVRREKLGQRGVSDLLCVSFSANDAVGHAWGPDSQEVMDITLRTDALLSRFFKELDALVGRGEYGVVLSADHGVCRVPEVARARGDKQAMRIDGTKVWQGLVAHLRKRFGLGEKVQPLLGSMDENIYLNAKAFGATDLAVVRESAAEWLRKQAGIGACFTREQLESDAPSDAPFIHQARLSFHPKSSGDLLALPARGCLVGSATTTTGTTHGTPYEYDTHVPLLAFGPGIRPGRRDNKVSCLATAAILANFLEVKPPPMSEPAPGDLR